MTYHLHRPTTKHRIRAWLVIGIMLSSFITSISIGIVQASTDTIPVPLPTLIINQLQTGGCIDNLNSPCVEDTKNEFIELYNTQSTPLQISDWKVRYVSASGNTPTNLVTLNGRIGAHGYVLLAHVGYYPDADVFFGTITSGSLAKTGGHIEIIDSSNNSIDRVGWGTAALAQTKPVIAVGPGLSAERGTDAITGTPLYSGDNSKDFTIQTAPTPQGGGYTANEAETPVPTPIPVSVPPIAVPPAEVPTTTPVQPTPSPMPEPSPSVPPSLDCDDIAISELLPNPAGTDTGHEFIEIHNLTADVLSMNGCSLQTSASTTKSFALTGSLAPDAYLALYDSATGLTLPNGAGGTVTLAGQTNELQVIYPGDMDDDTTWTLTGDTNWAASFSATPNTANIATPLKPCDAGQIRNPETNRCVNETSAATTASAASPASTSATTTSTSTPAPCKEGQERNPATNRCRNIVASAAAVAATAACKAGQERNPETNRCKNIAATASSTAKACLAGQERNAETNRCRKITAAGSSNGSTLDGVKDVASTSSSKSKPYWLIAVVALAAAIGYGVYEWRQEIMLFIRKYSGKPLPAMQPTTQR